ncbi:class I SAM-dependent RNA methyltransferase [Thalassococcus sp. CAU 1522]|uniref:Class I SAM-dependent RNA methyltransferase n=1 Tax=Thalassococcus arenae TaxID=2851652 RepID=A0ABS6N3V6_9RHOB|nr:class I SAM-dependent RNA methyltransferase [Thalassococcus arenae]MBV2358694.1 class I SAM-dependent RNA methyltransferase [Thalassococcus arenae]
MQPEFDIFLATLPGLEDTLRDEAVSLGFAAPQAVPGGVTVRGGWPDIWRANLSLRCASRVLVRLAAFRAMHLAQLDKRARKLDWAAWLRSDVPVKIDATCKGSRIYHEKAARQRIEGAIVDTLGAAIVEDAPLRLMLRIEDDLATLSLDTSGEPLHRRGHKQAVGKAPLRETMAAAFLRQCGFDGTQPVVDPMCGSGTFVIEAAEIARGLLPGRSRAFAFEHLASFDADAFAALKSPPLRETGLVFRGSDRDQGAVQMARANADRAGVADITDFACHPVSEMQRPDSAPGLVMVNPPYGARIGNRKLLFALYGALGETLKSGFSGWRVGLVTSDAGLAKATGLPWRPSGPPIPHGPLKVTLYRTDPLP